MGEFNKHTSIPSCCNLGWYHLECMQKNAIHSAIAMKCPSCGDNHREYSEFLKTNYDIYVPKRLPSWERSPERYSGMKVEHECAAKVCHYHGGRSIGEVSGDWKLNVCAICGSTAAHSKCHEGEQFFTCEKCDIGSKDELLDKISTVELVTKDKTKGLKYRTFSDDDDDD